MNERIKQLAEQAGMIIVDDGFSTYGKFAEKFAELIVKECVKFCEHESNDDEHDEYDMGMWVKAESIKTAIIEEFGIKE
jgi:hypothetical protein